MEVDRQIQVKVADRLISMSPQETLLEACERAGVEVTSSCRAGACQSCIMRATSGAPPSNSQVGLKEVYRQQGYFLACLCRPREDFQCESGAVDKFRGTGTISGIKIIGPDVVAVSWHRPRGLDFFAGQFLSFRWPDGLSRSYSIATLPSDQETFDIHVRRVAGGQKSHWFHDRAKVGDELSINGARGDCFYTNEDPSRPILLIGAGTGIAPLHAIAKDALNQGHTGTIQIIQAGQTVERLYFVRELRSLADSHAHVHHLQCVREGEHTADIHVGDVVKLVLDQKKILLAPRVYLCGDPTLVANLKKQLFLAGVSLKDIHADAFVGSN